MQGRVLIVDDDRDMCVLLESQLKRRDINASWRASAAEALDLLAVEDFEVLVTDINLQGTSGLELCEKVVTNRPDMPVIMITAYGSLESAIAAIRSGAYDFVNKPFELDELVLTINRALQHRSLREEVKRLKAAVATTQRMDELVGDSMGMRKVYDLLERVADTEATVLITGESGTGKELVARALHRRSQRKNGPFVAINCAAMPESLLESELFGHTKGAFTDAKSGRSGLLQQASGGTLFFDEIGEMPLGMQPKLLRSLQERTVRPVGGNEELPFDARIVAATNRDLESEVEANRFREDLFYRINVVRIDVPPLRMRSNDVLLLAQYSLEKIAARSGKRVVGISSGAAEKLLAYDWPGNVRELQNCIERAVALTRYDTIVVEDLPEKIREYRSSNIVVATEDASQLLPMEEVERRYILRVLKTVGGNKTTAAKVLGFDRRTLYRKLERYGVADGD
jgi:two-component system, NtrC family, response regulator AtoC